MQKFKLHSSAVLVAILLLCAVLVGKFSYNAGYNKGWDRGADDIFKATIDTVQAICDKQLKSDTSVTKLVLINPDTSTYYLSRKSVLSK